MTAPPGATPAGRLTPEALAERYPRLWHMAEAGSWPAIREHGLLSTSALLDRFDVTGEARVALERRHRPASVTLTHPEHGTAVVRDQGPMSDAALRRALTGGMTPADWYATLNARVFLWLSERRLERLLSARAYRDRPHDVVVVDTAALLARHADRVTLSPINSGATFRHPAPRGPDTFRRIPDHPWGPRAKDRREPVELAVDHAVPDIADLVVEVQEGRAATTA